MSIDLRNSEELLTMSQVAGFLRKKYGISVHPKTLSRWAREGRKGVRLTTIRIGRRVFTTLTEFQWFCELTDFMSPSNTIPQTNYESEEEIEIQLKKLGF